jgi:hypothetical protein
MIERVVMDLKWEVALPAKMGNGQSAIREKGK